MIFSGLRVELGVNLIILKTYFQSLKLNNCIRLQSWGCFVTVSGVRYIYLVYSLCVLPNNHIPSVRQLDRFTVLCTFVFSFIFIWSVGDSPEFFKGFVLPAENTLSQPIYSRFFFSRYQTSLGWLTDLERIPRTSS